jgi:hypothetical protein
MLLPNLIPLIDVTFSTPTRDCAKCYFPNQIQPSRPSLTSDDPSATILP